jgi:hypothetical protein
MDPEPTDPGKYRQTSVSVDTRFADQVYDSNTADFMIRLPNTMRHVARIALSSVELPLVEYTFSDKKGNIDFDISGHAGTLKIPEGSYSGTSLAAAITKVLSPVVAGAVCKYDHDTDRISFTATGTAYVLTWVSSEPLIAARAKYWGLGYYLGFRDFVVEIPANSTVIAEAPPSVLQPAYYLLQLQCPDMVETTLHRTAANSSVPALAKLVLRDGFFQMQYNDSGNYVRKEITFVTPSAISQLRVRLLDAYGEIVQMGDTDWSMTFDILEFTNACQGGLRTWVYGAPC